MSYSIEGYFKYTTKVFEWETSFMSNDILDKNTCESCKNFTSLLWNNILNNFLVKEFQFSLNESVNNTNSTLGYKQLVKNLTM